MRKLISVFLTLAMLLTMVPATVFATYEDPETDELVLEELTLEEPLEIESPFEIEKTSIEEEPTVEEELEVVEEVLIEEEPVEEEPVIEEVEQEEEPVEEPEQVVEEEVVEEQPIEEEQVVEEEVTTEPAIEVEEEVVEEEPTLLEEAVEVLEEVVVEPLKALVEPLLTALSPVVVVEEESFINGTATVKLSFSEDVSVNTIHLAIINKANEEDISSIDTLPADYEGGDEVTVSVGKPNYNCSNDYRVEVLVSTEDETDPSFYFDHGALEPLFEVDHVNCFNGSFSVFVKTIEDGMVCAGYGFTATCDLYDEDGLAEGNVRLKTVHEPDLVDSYSYTGHVRFTLPDYDGETYTAVLHITYDDCEGRIYPELTVGDVEVIAPEPAACKIVETSFDKGIFTVEFEALEDCDVYDIDVNGCIDLPGVWEESCIYAYFDNLEKGDRKTITLRLAEYNDIYPYEFEVYIDTGYNKFEVDEFFNYDAVGDADDGYIWEYVYSLHHSMTFTNMGHKAIKDIKVTILRGGEVVNDECETQTYPTTLEAGQDFDFDIGWIGGYDAAVVSYENAGGCRCIWKAEKVDGVVYTTHITDTSTKPINVEEPEGKDELTELQEKVEELEKKLEEAKGETTIIYRSSGGGSVTPEPVEEPTPVVVIASNDEASVIKFVSEHNIMQTTDGENFNGDAALTRASMMRILYNMDGMPELTSTNNIFTDVVDTHWGVDVINWAAGKGYVNGYGNGKFGPDDVITAKQFIQIMKNFSGVDVVVDDLDAPITRLQAARAIKYVIENRDK